MIMDMFGTTVLFRTFGEAKGLLLVYMFHTYQILPIEFLQSRFEYLNPETNYSPRDFVKAAPFFGLILQAENLFLFLTNETPCFLQRTFHFPSLPFPSPCVHSCSVML